MNDQIEILKITEEEWGEKFKPTANKIVPGQGFDFSGASKDDNSSLYGTTDEERAELKRVGPNHVWTILEGDHDEIYIVNGIRHVNRIGYIITEEPWTEEYEIELD